jgi:radial spoke head protein 4A
VAEGVTSHLYQDIMDSNVEPKGEGVNTYTYYVTHDVLLDWFELPLVTPEQIIKAREIKHIFTGDLNAELDTYPPYPGKEKHFLKS